MRVLTLTLVACMACAAAADTSVTVGDTLGRVFDGIGGLSGGGATSRLLVSYPEEQLSGLLDLLFKPDYLASLQILKVEIGGDAQSTDGTESSHQHYEGETPNFNRGYEWYLLKEAKARNPNIKTYGLPWAWPGWVGDAAANNPYVNDTKAADYIVTWVDGAKSAHGIDIDYVGIWNERGYTKSYIETLRETLDAHGHTNTQVVAHDRNFDIVDDILTDSKFAASISTIGVHYPGSESPADAEATGKPMWASEDMSTYNDNRGAQCWAKILNRNYVMGNFTATISWNLIASYYHGLKWYGTGLMTATEPWSGHYDDEHMGMMWATAHTTRFTEVGWTYLAVGSGSGMLSAGGSYVSLTDGQGSLTIVVEKMAWRHSNCIRPDTAEYDTTAETVTFQLTENWNFVSSLRVYRTQYGWSGDQQTNNTYMEHLADVTVDPTTHTFTLDVPVDSIITLSTRDALTMPSLPSNPASAPFPVPYKDDFNSYAVSQEAAYWADQAGVWEIQEAADSSHGKVMRQMVPAAPISWSGDYAPFSVIGDTQWSDVVVQLDVLIEKSDGLAFLGARTRACCEPAGLYMAISATGQYVVASDFKTATTHGSGPSSAGWIGGGMADVTANNWYTLKLVVQGNKATGYLGANTLFSGATVDVSTGWVSMGTGRDVSTGAFDAAQFDNVVITSAAALQCPKPSAGVALTAQWCGGANTANTQWTFDWDSGSIALKADPSLCMAVSASGSQLELAACNTSSAAQQFSRSPSAQLPWYSLGADGKVITGSLTPDQGIALKTAGEGTAAAPCDASEAAQQFTLTTEGMLKSANGSCVSSYCKDVGVGCEPLHVTECDASNKALLWEHTASGALQSRDNGGCMALWFSGAGPGVGIYTCEQRDFEQWQVEGQLLKNGAAGDRCLELSAAIESGTGLMIDEFGKGEITPYGPFVTDVCVAACL